MKTSVILGCAALVAAMAVAIPAISGPPSLAVGSAAPGLELAATDGSSRSLAAIDGPRVLIFYRGLW
jgi:hypothetical protein